MLAVVLTCAVAAPAQESLTCGVPVLGTLAPGGKDTYRVATHPGVAIAIQSSALSPELGTRRMRLLGTPKVTCTGILEYTGQAEEILTLEVEQCSGTTGGAYTLTLNVVSDDPDNCGWPVPCGATPAGTELLVPGEVDSFRVALTAGEPADLTVNYLNPGDPTAPLLTVYDPDGHEVTHSFTGTLKVNPAASGTYTGLVSAYGTPVRRAYGMELYHPGCPVGPTITYFGIIDSFANPLPPIGFDSARRPIFNHQIGSSLSLFVEARAGASKLRPGDFTVPQGGRAADLQVILANPLGDGAPAVCDTVEPNIGGVPATVPLIFEPTTQTTLDHINDMGCRFDDGQGRPIGRRNPDEACTRTNQRFEFSFVDRRSFIQYCTDRIQNAWAFADGDTVVATRAQDLSGNFGAPREIVVRIGDPQPPTLTPTPTPTPRPPTRTATTSSTRPPPRTETATRTPTDRRTPTITPTPDPFLCAGDCGNNRQVTVDEIVVMLNIALGSSSLDDCRAGDADGDGNIFIGDLLKAVNRLLGSCPPLPSP